MDDQADMITYGNADLPKGTDERPLVTFAVFAYNQEKYIREAVEGAFSQTYSPLEIILSDDCSSDRTYEIILEMRERYRGPHKIVVRKSEENRGLASHVNAVLAESHGEIFVASAGDDISHPTRVERTADEMLQNTRCTFVETACMEISSNGLPIKAYKAAVPSNGVTLTDYLEGRVTGLIGASRAYNTGALRAFPPLNTGCPTEDTTFLLRSLIIGCGVYINDALVNRRVHDLSLSSRGGLRKMNLDHILNQYLSDVDHARTRNLIDSRTAKRLQAFAKQSIKRRKANQIISSNLRLIDFLATSIKQLGIGKTSLYALVKYVAGGKNNA